LASAQAGDGEVLTLVETVTLPARAVAFTFRED
jgi:hypothetical protein